MSLMILAHLALKLCFCSKNQSSYLSLKKKKFLHKIAKKWKKDTREKERREGGKKREKRARKGQGGKGEAGKEERPASWGRLQGGILLTPELGGNEGSCLAS